MQDIKEKEFNFLKTPLLIDVIKFANKEGQNQQIKENERQDYLNLARKLDGIDKLEIFLILIKLILVMLIFYPWI